MLAIILSVLGIGGIGAAAFAFPVFGLFLKGALKGIWEFVKSIPWQVWVAIAAALLVWKLYDYHQDVAKAHAKEVADAYSRGDHDGYMRAMGEVRDKAEAIRVKAEAARRKAESASQTITQEVQNARETALADLRARAKRLRDRQHPAAQGDAGGVGANLPGVPGASLAGPTGSAVDAGLAVVPRAQLIDFAEGHDKCQVDLKTWETWYDRQKAVIDNWQPPPE